MSCFVCCVCVSSFWPKIICLDSLIFCVSQIQEYNCCINTSHKNIMSQLISKEKAGEKRETKMYMENRNYAQFSSISNIPLNGSVRPLFFFDDFIIIFLLYNFLHFAFRMWVKVFPNRWVPLLFHLPIHKIYELNFIIESCPDHCCFIVFVKKAKPNSIETDTQNGFSIDVGEIYREKKKLIFISNINERKTTLSLSMVWFVQFFSFQLELNIDMSAFR